MNDHPVFTEKNPMMEEAGPFYAKILLMVKEKHDKTAGEIEFVYEDMQSREKFKLF